MRLFLRDRLLNLRKFSVTSKEDILEGRDMELVNSVSDAELRALKRQKTYERLKGFAEIGLGAFIGVPALSGYSKYRRPRAIDEMYERHPYYVRPAQKGFLPSWSDNTVPKQMFEIGAKAFTPAIGLLGAGLMAKGAYDVWKTY